MDRGGGPSGRGTAPERGGAAHRAHGEPLGSGGDFQAAGARGRPGLAVRSNQRDAGRRPGRAPALRGVPVRRLRRPLMEGEMVIRALVTIGVGAISGGLTNAVAIWMLFHPYELRGLGPFRIQGAIPKNKARLARTIGRTVGERLLPPEDLATRLSAPAVRAAFDQAVAQFLDGILDRERGPLREQLDPELAASLDQAMAGLAPRVADGIASYARSPEFEALVIRW